MAADPPKPPSCPSEAGLSAERWIFAATEGGAGRAAESPFRPNPHAPELDAPLFEILPPRRLTDREREEFAAEATTAGPIVRFNHGCRMSPRRLDQLEADPEVSAALRDLSADLVRIVATLEAPEEAGEPDIRDPAGALHISAPPGPGK